MTDLVAALSSTAAFVQLVGSPGFDAKEALNAVPRRCQSQLWQGLRHQVEQGVSAFHVEVNEASSRHNMGQATVALLAATTLLQHALAQDPHALPVIAQQAAGLLHDGALLAGGDAPELQEAVAQLCIAWWQAGGPAKETLITQTLPYIIVKALMTGRASDVRRCCVMREALALLDWDDASITDLRRLVLRAALAPPFLRSQHGRRFLAALFALQPHLVRELGAVVRNTIPGGRKSVAQAYGDVLFRGWRASAGACREEVEQLVQGLMQAAVLASTQALAAALRYVLDAFHAQKATAGVDALLLRLYQPILFRALSAANGAVRRNAFELLVDAFPLQDPEAPNAEAEVLLVRQFELLGAALGDPAPSMRAAAAGGVARVLRAFWELIPAAVTAGLIKRLASEVAFDTAAPAVRAAGMRALASLVDDPLAQPVLKAALPGLQRLLDDPALSVRIALIDLLLAVGAVRGLQVWDIVPAEALIAALSTEAPAVAVRIQRLLMPALFPGPKIGAPQVAALLRQAPAAGRAFCRMLVAGAPGACTPPPEDVVELVVALRDHLLALGPINDIDGQQSNAVVANSGAPGASKPKAAAKRKATGRGKRKMAAASQGAPAEDVQASETPAARAALLWGIAELCAGLVAVLADSDAAGAPPQLAILFADGHLAALARVGGTLGARAAVLATAATMPRLPSARQVADMCLAEMMSGDTSNLRSRLQCMCAVDGPKRMVDVLAAALRSVAGAPSSEASGPMLPVDVAIAAASAMIADAPLRALLVAAPGLVGVLDALAALAECGAAAALAALRPEAGKAAAPAAALGVQAILPYVRLAMHLGLDAPPASPSLSPVPSAGDQDTERGIVRSSAAGAGIMAGLRLAAQLVGGLEVWAAAEVPSLEAQDGPAPAKRGRISLTTSASPAAQHEHCTASLVRDVHAVAVGTAAMACDAACQLGQGLPDVAEEACRLLTRILVWEASPQASMHIGTPLSAALTCAHALLSSLPVCAALPGQQPVASPGLTDKAMEEFWALAYAALDAAAASVQKGDALPLLKASRLGTLVAALCHAPGAERHSRWLVDLARRAHARSPEASKAGLGDAQGAHPGTQKEADLWLTYMLAAFSAAKEEAAVVRLATAAANAAQDGHDDATSTNLLQLISLVKKHAPSAGQR